VFNYGTVGDYCSHNAFTRQLCFTETFPRINSRSIYSFLSLYQILQGFFLPSFSRTNTLVTFRPLWNPRIEPPTFIVHCSDFLPFTAATYSIASLYALASGKTNLNVKLIHSNKSLYFYSPVAVLRLLFRIPFGALLLLQQTRLFLSGAKTLSHSPSLFLSLVRLLQ